MIIIAIRWQSRNTAWHSQGKNEPETYKVDSVDDKWTGHQRRNTSLAKHRILESFREEFDMILAKETKRIS